MRIDNPMTLNNPLFLQSPEEVESIDSIEKIDELLDILANERDRLLTIMTWLQKRRDKLAGVAS